LIIRDLNTSEFSRLLAERIGEATHKLWFGDQIKLLWSPPTLTVGVANRHFVEWLSERYGKILADLAKELAGEEATVVIRIDQELFRQLRDRLGEQPGKVATQPNRTSDATNATPSQLPQALAGNLGPTSSRKPVKRLRSLASFFPGITNRQALTAANAVGKRLISSGTVLFAGPHGVGKTHLLEGIALASRESHQSGKTLLFSAEEFLQKFLANLRSNTTGQWRRWVRAHELFLLDDLHRLAGKRSTQEELLHHLDQLQRQGGIFVASTTDWDKCRTCLIPELADRLSSGVHSKLALPDGLSKSAIFHQSLESMDRVLMATEVPAWIGNNLPGTAREIQGAAQTLWLAAKTRGVPIDLELAREVLGHLTQNTQSPKQLEDIESAITRILGLDWGALRGKSRDKRLTVPRFLASYLARKFTTASATEIGAFLGGRSHSTVLDGDKRIKAWMGPKSGNSDRPPGLEVLIERLENHLQANQTDR